METDKNKTNHEPDLSLIKRHNQRDMLRMRIEQPTLYEAYQRIKNQDSTSEDPDPTKPAA